MGWPPTSTSEFPCILCMQAFALVIEALRSHAPRSKKHQDLEKLSAQTQYSESTGPSPETEQVVETSEVPVKDFQKPSEVTYAPSISTDDTLTAEVLYALDFVTTRSSLRTVDEASKLFEEMASSSKKLTPEIMETPRLEFAWT